MNYKQNTGRSVKKKVKAAAALMLAMLLMFTAAGCSSSTTSDSGTAGTSSTLTQVLAASDLFSDRDLSNTYDQEGAATISLADGASTSSDSSVSIDGNTITITQEGVYVVSGTLADGQIIVDADDDAKVQIVLNGADITNDTSAAIYCKNADKLFVTANENTTNSLKVTGTYEADGDTNVDGVIFSKCDLTLNGLGTLNIESSEGNGVVGKDDVKLGGLTLTIDASKHGIQGNDSIRIADGTYNITAGEDGIHCDNDNDSDNLEENGYIYILDGTVSISAGDDGIHAGGYLTISGGTETVSKSYEGIEGHVITVNDGTVSVTSSDDGFNASSGGSGDSMTGGPQGGQGGMQGFPGNGDQTSGSTTDTPSGNGTMTAPSGTSSQQGSTADTSSAASSQTSASADSTQVTAGTLTTADTTVTADLTAAQTDTSSSADTSGSADSDTTTSTSDIVLTINGGNITVNADGDGLDSNGDIYITGGTTYVAGPSDNGNAAIDYGDQCKSVITGGTVVAAGFSGMATNFGDESTQGSILVNLDSTETGKITLTDSDGNELASYTPDKEYNCVVVSTPEIKDGETYTLTAGSTSQEITMDGLIYGESSGMGGGMPGSGFGGGQGHGMKDRSQTSSSDSASSAS